MAVIHKLFSKKGRAAIYGLFAALLAIAGVLGLVTADQAEQAATSVASLLGALAPILALFNLTPDEDAPVEGV